MRGSVPLYATVSLLKHKQSINPVFSCEVRISQDIGIICFLREIMLYYCCGASECKCHRTGVLLAGRQRISGRKKISSIRRVSGILSRPQRREFSRGKYSDSAYLPNYKILYTEPSGGVRGRGGGGSLARDE